MVNQYTNN